MQATHEVALYVRVSSEAQVQGYSLDGQEAVLRADVKRRSKFVFKVYRDAGVSGFHEDRTGINELLHDAREGCFGEVLVWTVSRVSRKLSFLLTIIDELKQYGVALRSLSENFDADSPTGKMVLSTMGAIAEMQRSSWMESSRIGTERRTKEGRWSGGIPLGYVMTPDQQDTRGGGKLEIVPDEADTVRDIFQWYAVGLGYKAIVNRLNEEGRKTKLGNKFAVGAIKVILTNRLYIGEVVLGGVESEGIHEPIVTQELWQTVQELLQQKFKVVEKTISREYLLSGILRCPNCGSGMLPVHIKNRRQDGSFRINHYYNCGAYMNKGKAACRANSVRADEAEEKVLHWLQDILSSPFWAKKVAETVKERQTAEQVPKEAERRTLNAELADIAKKQKGLLAAYESGKLVRDEFLAEAQVLKLEKEELTDKLSAFGSTERTVTWTADDVQASFRVFRKVLSKASSAKKHELIRALVDKVLTNEDREVVELELKVPLPERGGQEVALVQLRQVE